MGYNLLITSSNSVKYRKHVSVGSTLMINAAVPFQGIMATEITLSWFGWNGRIWKMENCTCGHISSEVLRQIAKWAFSVFAGGSAKLHTRPGDTTCNGLTFALDAPARNCGHSAQQHVS